MVGTTRSASSSRAAMDPSYSKLLINQWVIPAQGASRLMTLQDLNMMTVLASVERTEQQWRSLLDTAGFEIVQIWKPNDEVSEHLIEAIVKV